MTTLEKPLDVLDHTLEPSTNTNDQWWDGDDNSGSSGPGLRGKIVLYGALSLFSLTATSNSTAITNAPDVQVARNWSTSGGFLTVANHQTSAVAQQIENLHRRSGLTWSELARAFGTTRRTLHNWANGRRMSGRHVDTFRALIQLIDTHDKKDPEQTRAFLITPDDSGESPLSAFFAEHRSVPKNPDGFSPEQLL